MRQPWKILSLLLLLVSTACADIAAPPAGVEDPFLGLLPDVTARPGFAFLPPLGAPHQTDGELLGALAPLLSVEVCVVDGRDCSEVVARVEAGDVRVVGNRFQAHWRVGRDLDPAPEYRLRVLAGPAEMGNVAVEISKRGRPKSGRFVARPGSTVPVAFTIDSGSIFGDLRSSVRWPVTVDAAGSVGKLAGVSVDPDARIALYAGGEVAPAMALEGGGVLASLPYYLGDGVWPAPPTDPVDLMLFEDGEPIAWSRAALTVTPPADAPGSAGQAVAHLTRIAGGLERLSSGYSQPSEEEAWGIASARALAGLLTADDPHSFVSALAAADADELRFLDAWFAASGVLAVVEEFADRVERVTGGAGIAPVAGAVPFGVARPGSVPGISDRSSFPMEAGSSPMLTPTSIGGTGSQLPAGILAERMQLYEVSSLLGSTLISQTATDFGNYVGLAAGALGLLGPGALGAGAVAAPTVAITGAVLAIADFAVNKVAVGVLPAVVDGVTLDIAKTTLSPSEETISEVRIQASNVPPQIGVQDIVSTTLAALGGVGAFGPAADAQAFRDVLLDVAAFYLGAMQSALAQYSAAYPEANIDVSVASVPAMTWWANVLDRSLIEPVSLAPHIVAAQSGQIEWQADASRLGSAAVYVRTATGPASHRLDLPPGVEYFGGAFGAGSTSSPSLTLRVVGELVLAVTFTSQIDPNGVAALEARAGYLDADGDTLWVPGISIALIVEGGTVQDLSGATDTDGQFVTLAQIAPGADEIIISVTASDDTGQQVTSSVSATTTTDPGTLDILSIYAAYGGGARASESGSPSEQDFRSDWTNQLGSLSGSESFSSASGASRASASVQHQHSISLPGSGVLLSASVQGQMSAQAHALSSLGGRATGSAGSDLHVRFEVKDHPVYLEFSGESRASEGAAFYGAIEVRDTDRNVLLVDRATPSTLQSVNGAVILPPGRYSLDVFVATIARAGLGGSMPEGSLQGEAMHDLTFTIRASPPSS